MKYFFGSSFSRRVHIDVLEKINHKKVLYSYATFSKNNSKQHLEFLDILGRRDFDVILDSGAFSAWNSNKPVNREKLLLFYKEAEKRIPRLVKINLDDIPGKVGIMPTAEDIEESCRISKENWIWFKEQNVDTLPVFHQHDNFDYLRYYMEQTDFIAISPANDRTTKERIVWLDKVYSILKGNYKTHGLAATSSKLLERYPFYSVDSINWVAPLMYATSRVFKKDYTRIIAREAGDLMLRAEANYLKELEQHATKLWEKRGIKWE